MNIRLLKANEIDVRVGSINEKGATLLLYKDARVDMNILDETFTPWGWQRKHYELKGHIYASVGVKINEYWVWKDDVGTESVSEATKGESSDSFKRACFNWGIGRELYSAPFTWISSNNYTPYKNQKTGKLGTYDKFSVESIGFDENKEISLLVVKNNKTNKNVFSFSKYATAPENKATFPQLEVAHKTKGWIPSPDKPVSDDQRLMIHNLLRKQGVEGPDDINSYLWDNFGALPSNELEAYEVLNSLDAKEQKSD